AGLVVIIGLLAVLVLTIRRHGQNTSTALVPMNGSPPMRAATDALPERQDQLLREKLMPELSEFAKQSLVQGLYSQRNELLETQKQAEAYLATLEQRLATMHLPLQERIRAYEARIIDLEKGFETRDQELRELTRATLALVRQRLDQEREKVRSGTQFN
ncbi:MAG TPA: hypothetical protein PKA41_11600, partial [Verrucomicrobiota bacterium]|nr:hypothetical protein [Verrucomicrobiota bacterium]